MNAKRFGWEQLLPVQQWTPENTLGVQAAEENERPVKRTQGTMWASTSRQHGSSTPAKGT